MLALVMKNLMNILSTFGTSSKNQSYPAALASIRRLLGAQQPGFLLGRMTSDVDGILFGLLYVGK